MRIEEWWPKLDSATQEWLIANNGDVVPTTVLGQIAEVGGDVTSDASSIGDNGPGGFLLSDAAIDWIEETANRDRFRWVARSPRRRLPRQTFEACLVMASSIARS